MAKRKAEQAPIEPKIFTLEEIIQGIEKLNRRLSDLQKLESEKVSYEDERANNLEFSIKETIREVFGPNSPEFDRYQYHRIWDGPTIMGGDGYEQQYFESGIKKTVTLLQGLIDRLEEKKHDLGFDTKANQKAVFRGFDLHERVRTVADELYENGHYADAVFNACKVLINCVQEKSGRFDLDGSKLMAEVFSKNSPILVFNDLSDQTDLDEQEGMMHLFIGVTLGIRNPRGHAILDDDPQQALEYLILISHLIKSLNKATKTKK
jgi:uncharacterized protein (TIGR02391 family)